MKTKTAGVFFVLLAGLIVSCSTEPEAGSPGLLSARTLRLVEDAVFEVVLEKPVEDPTVYEKELDWENIPFAVRSDKYYSIGTAFAISKTELVTAFHVINLGFESRVQKKYFVRDSSGTVYEVDQVTAGSNERDYLVFTVKDKTFGEFFQFERNHKTGDPVFSIGNALGEGIVVRNGLVLGTVPEEDSGRWNLLKSSADGNPGNSGGPLVTPAGKVVALVTALRDNILYSVPAGEILDGSRSALAYRVKSNYGHLLLPDRVTNVLETRVPLPAAYADVRKTLRGAYRSHYDASMTALFDEAPEYLSGPNNAYLLNSSLTASFPEISFVDPNDSNWKLSGLEKKSYQLDDDGRLTHAYVSGYNFYKIKRPRPVPLEKICTDPKYIMDLLLQTLRTERTLWANDKYRILSFGEPSSAGQFRDSLGRTWITAHWPLDFDDKALVMYILPLPNGPALITTLQAGEFIDDYEWDIRKICEHTFTAYEGTFTEWNDFLALKKYIPGFLDDLNFEWKSGEQRFVLDCDSMSLNADKQIFDWADDSNFFLAPSWYKTNNRLEFGIRKIILSGDLRGNDYIVLFRHTRPDPKLGSGAMENWNDLVNGKYPFDEKPGISVKDNTGSVGGIVDTARANPDLLYTLYLSMINPLNEENLSLRFNALKQGVSITD